jgi:hypothetical protein
MHRSASRFRLNGREAPRGCGVASPGRGCLPGGVAGRGRKPAEGGGGASGYRSRRRRQVGRATGTRQPTEQGQRWEARVAPHLHHLGYPSRPDQPAHDPRRLALGQRPGPGRVVHPEHLQGFPPSDRLGHTRGQRRPVMRLGGMNGRHVEVRLREGVIGDAGDHGQRLAETRTYCELIPFPCATWPEGLDTDSVMNQGPAPRIPRSPARVRTLSPQPPGRDALGGACDRLRRGVGRA